MKDIIDYYQWEDNNDSKILAAALYYSKHNMLLGEKCIFYTNDLAFKKIAESVFDV